MFRWLVLWCLFVGTSAGQAPAPAATPPCAVCTAKTIACPTCAATGTVSVPCAFCDGDGSLECSACAEGKPGKADCPNPTCREGRTQWDTGMTDPCKLCAAKGVVACPGCRGKPAARCVACAGSGKRARTCHTCTGAKRLPCPACSADPRASTCTTCDDSGAPSCRLCADKKPPAKHACIACNGVGGFACFRCQTLDRVPCEKCGASGKMRLRERGIGGVGGDKAGVKQCDRCEGKGLRNCPDCKEGMRDCTECERGLVAIGCHGCLHRGTLPCHDCLSGSIAQRELFATFLLGAGHAAASIPWFEHALAAARGFSGPRGKAGTAAMVGLVKTIETPKLPLAGPPRFLALPPAALPGERVAPRDVRASLWPDPPKDRIGPPWLDAAWCEAQRARHVARLEQALANARAAAAR